MKEVRPILTKMEELVKLKTRKTVEWRSRAYYYIRRESEARLSHMHSIDQFMNRHILSLK